MQGRIVRLQCWAMPSEWDDEYRAVVDFADQELAGARARKDRITETGLLACRAFHQQMLGNMEQAKEDYQQALVLARRLGDRVQEADILSLRGDMYAYQGELAEGLMELIEAHKRFESLGLDGKAREVLAQIANAYRRMGLYERAEGYFEELAHDYSALRAQEPLVRIRSQQGLLYSEMGEYDRALPLMKMAEQFYRSQQKEGLLAWVRIEIATILLNQGKVTEAVSKLRQADAILQGRESSDSVTLGHWQLVMGMAEAAQGNPTKALYYLAHAEPILRQGEEPALPGAGLRGAGADPGAAGADKRRPQQPQAVCRDQALAGTGAQGAALVADALRVRPGPQGAGEPGPQDQAAAAGGQAQAAAGAAPLAVRGGGPAVAGDGHAGAAPVQSLPPDAPARHDRRFDRAAQPPPDPEQGPELVQTGAGAGQALLGAAAGHRSLQAGQ
nr:tetratricopeptide repeat protein [Aeromonas dhakensis]